MTKQSKKYVEISKNKFCTWSCQLGKFFVQVLLKIIFLLQWQLTKGKETKNGNQTAWVFEEIFTESDFQYSLQLNNKLSITFKREVWIWLVIFCDQGIHCTKYQIFSVIDQWTKYGFQRLGVEIDYDFCCHSKMHYTDYNGRWKLSSQLFLCPATLW